MIRATLLALCAAALLAVGASAQTSSPSPAERFARSAEIWGVSMSPDGSHFAAIQRVELGEALVIISRETGQARAIQLARADRYLHIDWIEWKSDHRLVFVLRQNMWYFDLSVSGSVSDVDRFDVTRVFAVDRDGRGLTQMFQGEMRRLAVDYAPIRLIDIQANDPEHVLLGTYGRRGYTVYRANVTNGEVDSIEDADWNTGAIYVDGVGRPSMRVDFLPNGSGYQIYRRPERGGWRLAHEVRRSTISQNRDFYPLGPGPGAGQVYVAARPEGQEFQAIYLYNTLTGELGEPVFRHASADSQIAWLDPNDRSLMVGCAETQRWECRAQTPDMQRHFDGIARYFEGRADFSLEGVTRDDRAWLIYANGPTLPGAYFLYDLNTTQIAAVTATQPQTARMDLAPMRTVQYTSRDGVQLWGYLTEPVGGAGLHPLVVLPHGGPEIRDSYSYDFFVQFLASRGYAVFQPNFRGSEGSGRSFAEAGHRQWGRIMQHDITDGVQHLIDTGVVVRERICIVGASYGGYAALAGATLTPDLYRCAISIAGVSDLVEILNTERREEGRRSTTYAYWLRLIGDPTADAEALRAVSPAQLADRVQIPILLIHGTADGIVLASQSERMRDALNRAGKEVKYVPLENEGHIWSNWSAANRVRMLEETEQFLAAHIGSP
jgi:dipeptidyl aminopeptidase/acylaminoacyl peptidase